MTASERNELPALPSGYRYEPDLERLCRLAAWAGTAGRNESPLSFTALLIAFLLAEDPVSRWFQTYAERARVNAKLIFDDKKIATEKQRQEVVALADSGSLPQAQRLYSGSAETMLREAADFLQDRPSPSEPILGARHLMAAFAFNTPENHRAQLARWNFDIGDWREKLSAFLIEAWPDEPIWRYLPGAGTQSGQWPAIFAKLGIDLTRSASLILALARVLGPDRKEDNRLLTTSLILFALIELADQREVLEEAGPAVALGKTLREIAANRYDDVKDGYFRRRPRIPAPDQIEAEAAKSNVAGLSKNAQETLRLAAEAPFAPQPAPSPSGRKVVGLDRLAFGLLSMPPESRAWRTLHDMGIEPQSLRSRFIERLTAEYPQQADAWHKALGLAGHATVPEEAESTTRSSVAEERTGRSSVYVATYTADNVFAGRVRDLIGVEDEARAFARIAASKNIRPPMAIGVFGEWGSGKTFFMERMSEHVTSLSQGAAAAGLFYRDVVQIRFNAWHYMETNLWASLVEYIFHELDLWLRRRAPDKVDTLFDRLATSQQLKLEAIQELVFLRRQKKAAEQRLREARQRYDQGFIRPPAVTPQQFWRAVAQTMMAELSTEEKGEFEAARKRLGIDALRTSAQDMTRVLREASEQAGRGHVVARAVIARLGNVRWLIPATALVVLMVGGLVGLKEYLASTTAAPWIENVSSSVLGLAGMLTAIAGVVGTAVRRVSSALTTLESFKDKLDQAIVKEQQASEQSPSQAADKDERRLVDSKAAVEQAERRLAEIATRVDEAAREYESGTAEGRLNKFIRDKVVNGDYAKHLGLIATIRKDFSRLAQIMADDEASTAEREDQERQIQQYHEKVTAILRDSGGLLETSEQQSLRDSLLPVNSDLKLFTRIILYIDDLDRCPPAKVVEVLQAIHLLLYFPLFIVVVAVDARWVSRSLKKQFPELLEENVTLATRDVSGHSMAGAPSTAADGTSALPSNGNGDGAARRNGTDARSGHAASSQDYLEKIFQIPYWVRRMDGDASKRYVDGLVAPDLQGPDTSKTSGERDPSPKRPEAEAASAPRPPEHAPRDVAPSRGANIRRPTTTEASPDDAAQPGGRPASDGTVSTNNEKAPAPVPVDFKSLLLTRPESEFMRELAPYIGGSPRRGIRFVNVYRLIKTSLPDDLLDGLVGKDGRSLAYRGLLTHLAIVSGAPTIAHSYFQHLQSDRGRPETLAALREGLAAESWISESPEWLNIDGALRRIEALNAKAQLSVEGEMVEVMRELAPVAMRYSFTAQPHL